MESATPPLVNNTFKLIIHRLLSSHYLLFPCHCTLCIDTQPASHGGRGRRYARRNGEHHTIAGVAKSGVYRTGRVCGSERRTSTANPVVHILAQ